MTTVYKFKAVFTAAGIGAVPSSAPTIDIVDSSGNILVSAASPTSRVNMPEVYQYSYSGTDDLDLVAKFSTSDLSIDQQQIYSLPDIYSLIATRTTLGPGSTAITVTINDGVNPLDGVDVWLTTDVAGTDTIARGNTDALGNITFMLDAGTYYVWKQLAGYTFTNPNTLVVP